MIIFLDVKLEAHRGKEIESFGKRVVTLMQTDLGWTGKEIR